ncbi:MAG TPA: four helix bundle protein [Terriglobales bacterium]|jgi:four helix bundle protein|nr:four helix bundle protein [Terriglobales bacterium]
MNDFRRLNVWRKAHAFTLAIYRETSNFPRQELYGITSQMRRAAASVAANIAEGCGRGGDGEFHHFLNTAAGSSVELEYFLLLANDLGMLPHSVYTHLQQDVVEVQRMLSGLLKSVNSARQTLRPSGASRPGLAARGSQLEVRSSKVAAHSS